MDASSTSIPTTNRWHDAHNLAIHAVRRACRLAAAVYHDAHLSQNSSKDEISGTEAKNDDSPVTVADFGAQALIIKALLATNKDAGNTNSFAIVAEEDAQLPRTKPSMLEAVWARVQQAQRHQSAAERELLGGDIGSPEELLELLDTPKTKYMHENRPPNRDLDTVWMLDPVDGTKGFLRGGQYAVALALLHRGIPVVGVLGCPRLPVDPRAPILATNLPSLEDDAAVPKGVIVSAAEGAGAFCQPCGAIDGSQSPSSSRREYTVTGPLRIHQLQDPADATLCENVEAGHSDHGIQSELHKKLGIEKDSVRMDSRAKYATVARGGGSDGLDAYIYLRLSRRGETYRERAWDHAAGVVIVQQAGGLITDVAGNVPDFASGTQYVDGLVGGWVIAGKAMHPRVLATVQPVVRDALYGKGVPFPKDWVVAEGIE